MKHHHKIIEIVNCYNFGNIIAYNLVMDCPVQPNKIVVTTCDLKTEDVFDPHFSNEQVIARFQPTEAGWQYAIYFVRNF